MMCEVCGFYRRSKRVINLDLRILELEEKRRTMMYEFATLAHRIKLLKQKKYEILRSNIIVPQVQKRGRPKRADVYSHY